MGVSCLKNIVESNIIAFNRNKEKEKKKDNNIIEKEKK